MKLAVATRILYFGARYLSIMGVAKLLRQDASVFLLAVAIVDACRVIFDFGIETSILSRRHQLGEGAARIAALMPGFRIAATVAGQAVVLLIVLFAARSPGADAVALAAATQLTPLLTFGYFQALAQTDEGTRHADRIAAVLVAISLQCGLWGACAIGYLPVWTCAASFEWLALALGVRGVAVGRPAPRAGGSEWPRFLRDIVPIAAVNVISTLYGRLDAFMLSVLPSVAPQQYLFFQRLCSAPLMFCSTIASASMPAMAEHSRARRPGSAMPRAALVLAPASATAIWALAGPIGDAFGMVALDRSLLTMQALCLGVQVVNGFMAARNFATHRHALVWTVAKRCALAAAVVVPLGAMTAGIRGLAAGVLCVELVCLCLYIAAARTQRSR